MGRGLRPAVSARTETVLKGPSMRLLDDLVFGLPANLDFGVLHMPAEIEGLRPDGARSPARIKDRRSDPMAASKSMFAR